MARKKKTEAEALEIGRRLVVILILLMTPFFDDWDDERGKGE